MQTMNSIGETEAPNARVPRVVIVGGASVVWMSSIVERRS